MWLRAAIQSSNLKRQEQDCEIAQYYLCAEYGIDLPAYDYRWWDFVACMYRNQSTLSASDASLPPFQHVVASCAETAGFEPSKGKMLHECLAQRPHLAAQTTMGA